MPRNPVDEAIINGELDDPSLMEENVVEEDQQEVETVKVTKKEYKMYKAWIRMAKKKREEKFEPVAKRVKELWKNNSKPEWADDDTVTVDMVFPNMEIIKPSIFFRNPRIFVKPKQDVFVLEDGRQLDGVRAASLLEDAVNYVAYSNNLKRTVKKVRDDALLETYGIIFSAYEGLVGLNEEGKNYIKEDSIYSIRISPYEFLCDPEAKDSLNFSDAKWVAREYVISYKDFMDDDWYENKDDVGKKVTLRGYGEKITDKANNTTKSLLDYAGKSYGDSDDAKRLRLFEMWIKPTVKERAKLKKGEPGGRVVVICLESDEPHKAIKWPYKIMGFPFRGLAFYRDNEEFYPVSDVLHYEKQMEEMNKIRSAQLNWVKKFGNKKIVVNVDAFEDEEEIAKLEEPDSGPFIRVHAGQNGDIGKVCKELETGSAPNEMFVVDRKIMEDADRISGVGDIKRGLAANGIDSATESKIVSNSSSLRFVEKKDDIADMYCDVARIYIQLIKQYWTTETMVRRTGTLTPEWTDNFSNEDVQIEDDVEVDIGEMVPTDEIVRKKFGLELLNLIGQAMGNQALQSKLMEEGYKLSIAESLNEALMMIGIKNDKILTKASPDEYVKVLQGLVKSKMATVPGINPKGGSGARNPNTDIPSNISISNGVRRSMSIPGPMSIPGMRNE